MVTTPITRRLSFVALVSLTILCQGCASTTASLPVERVHAEGVTVSEAGSSSSGRFGFLRDIIQNARSSEDSKSSSSAFALPPITAVPQSAGFASSVSSAVSSSAPIPVVGGAWTSVNDVVCISSTPDRTEAFPGDIVTITIRVCNKSANTLTNVPVTFAYTGYEMTLVGASNGGMHTAGRLLRRTAPLRYDLPPMRTQTTVAAAAVTIDAAGVRSNQDRVDWTIPTFAPGETMTFTVTLRVSESLHRGDVVRGDSIAAPAGYPSVRCMDQITVLERLPFTGANLANPSSEAPFIEEPWRNAAADPSIR